MKKRSFFAVLLVIFAVGNVLCQNADELSIPDETDNQFPPEYSESDSYSEDSKSTTAEYTQPMPISTTDVPVSKLAEENDVVNNEGSETTITESTQTTPGLIMTVVDTVATSTTTDDQDNTNANSETTMEKIQTSESTDVAAETSDRTLESTTASVAAPILASNDELMNKGSESTVDEPSQTTSGSTTVDVAASVPENDDELVTNKESEATTEEPTQKTSDSTIVEVPTSTLTNDEEQVIDNQGSETTATESIPTTSESITIAQYPSELAHDADQTTVNEGSETTALEPINNVVDNTKLFSEESSCPGPCICITEADSSNYIVDCSDRGLTDFPTPIDPNTTTLKLQNNQLTAIPKGISELKNLINLNANDNLISELEFGSISELPKLVSLKLANNRFLEYPKELENASNLDKLEELDLGGNEMETAPEIFLNFKALRTVTLPDDSSKLVSQICNSLKETLATVCIKSCTEHSFLCSDVLEHSKDNSLDATLPGIIPFFHEIIKEDTKNLDDDSLANSVNSDTTKTSNPDAPETPSISTTKETSDMPLPPSNSRRKDSSEMPPEQQIPNMSSATKENLPASDFSLRTAVDNAPQEKVALQNTLIETPKESPNNEADVKVGAKTTETKSGGVDKSVIAVIVAGMVIIVAVIAIKKNWSSIRKRFSSTPRPNDRNTNGTTVTPEEVPLQDKSPV